MRNAIRIVSISFLIGLTAVALAQTPSHRRAKKATVKPVVLPPMPAGPLQPVPLDQLPAVPPQVNYQNGKLSIVAENSTLGDILREVHKKTGAMIDIPGNPMERVATKVGPGASRDVLATLLNGTSFNYVMVGSAKDPSVLSSIVLTQRSNAPVETAQVQAPVYTPPEPTNLGPGTGRPMPPGFVPAQIAQPGAAADAADDSDNSDDDAEDSSDGDQQQVAGQAEGQPGQQPNAGPRTPQQILQMMQRNQQQQQPSQQPPQNGEDQNPN